MWLVSSLAALAQSTTPTYSWTTLWGRASFGVEDGPKADARFRDPRGLAFDAAGNLYVADTGNHTIRRISPAGVVSTMAGSPGAAGSTDGSGVNARFLSPQGIAVDAAGNLIVADTGNHTLRRITPEGVVTTIAGAAGQPGFDDGPIATARLTQPVGVAVDRAGTIYVHARLRGIRRLRDGQIDTAVPGSVVNKLGSSHTPPFPSDAIAFGADDSLYFRGWDYLDGVGGEVIMRRDAAGTVATLNPSGDLVPRGALLLAGGPDGMYLMAFQAAEQTAPYWYYRLTASGIAQFVGRSWHPAKGMSVDATGAVFQCGFASASAQSIDAIARVPARPGAQGIGGGYAELWAGEINLMAGRNGEAAIARLGNGVGLAVDASRSLWVVDLRGSNEEARFRNHPVLLKLPVGGSSTVAAENPSAVRSQTESWGVSVAPDGLVYFGSANGSGQSWSLQTVTTTGTATTVAVLPYPELHQSRFLVVDSAGNQIFADGERLRKRSADGTWSTLAGVKGAGEIRDGAGADARFEEILGLAADQAGNVYALDGGSNSMVIRRVTSAGAVTTVSGNLLVAEGGSTLRPSGGLARDKTGNFFLIYDGGTVRRLDTGGNLEVIGGANNALNLTDGNGAAARFISPESIYVDSAGGVYLIDGFGTVIRKGTLLAAPMITVPPQSQTVTAGASVQFSVTAAGNPELTYQWSFNGVAISGATGSTHAISSAATIHAGDYTVTVGNTQGTVTSSVARLTVNPAPSPRAGSGGGGANGPLFTLAFAALWILRRRVARPAA